MLNFDCKTYLSYQSPYDTNHLCKNSKLLERSLISNFRLNLPAMIYVPGKESNSCIENHEGFVPHVLYNLGKSMFQLYSTPKNAHIIRIIFRAPPTFFTSDTFKVR